MAEVTQKINIKAGDTSGVDLLSDFQKEAAETRSELDNLKKSGTLSSFGIGADDIERATRSLDAFSAQAVVLEKDLSKAEIALAALDKASPDYDAQAAKVARLRKQFAELNETISDIPDTLTGYDDAFSRVSKRASVYGDVDTGIRDSAGIFAAAGGEAGAQLDQSATVVAEAFALAEALPRLETGFAELGKRGKELFSSFKDGVSSASTLGGAVSGGFTAITASVSPFLIIAGLVVATIGVFAAALNILNQQAEKARENTQKLAELIKQENQLRAEAAALAKAGNTAELQTRVDSAVTTQGIAQQDIDSLSGVLTTTRQQIEALGAVDLTELSAYNALKAQEAELQAQIADIQTNRLLPAMQEVNVLFEYLGEAAKAEDARKALEEQIVAIERRAELERQTAQLVQTGSAVAVQARLDQLAAEKEILNEQLSGYNELAGASEEARARAAELQGQLGRLGDEERVLAAEVLPLVEARERESVAISETLAGLDNRVQRELEMNQLLKDGDSDQINERLAAIEDEKKAIQNILPELERLAATSDEAKQALAGYQDRLSGLADETAMLESALPQVQARERQQALADMEQAEVESTAKIADLRKQGQAALVESENKFKEKLTQLANQRGKAIEDSQKKENKAIQDEQSKFAKDSRQRYTALFDDLEKAESDHAESIRKIRDDLNKELTQAERANDVVAFIRAQEAADEKLKLEAEGFSKENSERTEQFAKEEELRRAEFDARLQTIRTQAEEERTAIQERYLEQRQQAKAQADDEKKRIDERTAQQIAAEEAGLQKRLASITEKYNQEIKLAKEFLEERKKALAEETEAAAAEGEKRAETAKEQAQEVAKTEEQIAKDAADAKKQAEIAAAQEAADAIGRAFGTIPGTLQKDIAAMLAAIQKQAAQRPPAPAQNRREESAPPPRQRTPAPPPRPRAPARARAFANEGLVMASDGPTLALLGEQLEPGQVEAVIKFKPSEGIPQGKLGGDNVVFNINASIGDGVSMEIVQAGLRQLGMQLVQAVQEQRKA